MARLFPFRSEAPTTEGAPRIVGLEDEDADAVFSALSSTTARRIYAHISEEPGTPSDVAEAIDSSIQNVRYHLEKLEDAGLIEVVDTWYSSRGNEMSVYATADGPLIVTNDRSRAEKLREALSRFVGGVGALAGASALVQVGLGEWSLPFSRLGADDEAEPVAEPGDDEAREDDAEYHLETEDEREAEPEEEADTAVEEDPSQPDADEGVEDEPESDLDAEVETPIETPAPDAPVADMGPEATTMLPPGALFFLGGLVVLLAVTLWWYWRAY